MHSIVKYIVTACIAGGVFFYSPGLCAEKSAAGSGQVKDTAKAKEKKQTSTQKNTTQKNDTLIVIARVVEIPGKFAPNDLYNYVYVMKYRVLKVEKGAYTEKEILVGHYNPLIPRKNIKDRMSLFVKGDADRFEVGVKHRLVLITPIESVWKDAVEDEYFDSALTKYFALRADVAQ